MYEYVPRQKDKGGEKRRRAELSEDEETTKEMIKCVSAK